MSNPTSETSTSTPSSTDLLLHRILERLDHLEEKVNGVAMVAEHAQAAVVDTLDARVKALQDDGVDVDARLQAAGPLLERLTAPETAGALTRMLDRLEAAEQALEVAANAPQAIAAVTDTVDGFVAQAQANGLDLDARLQAALPMIERLTAPETSAAITRLLDRLDSAEQALELAQHGPNAIATAMDAFDDIVSDLQERDINIDTRARVLLDLLERTTRPEVSRALITLTKELPRLATVVEAMPNGIATAVDTLDDFVAGLSDRGVDVMTLAENMLTVATRVTNVLESPEFSALMNTGVLAPKTLEVIGKAGEALAATQMTDVPRVGMFGAIKAAGHPDTQKLLGFALTFAQNFGRHLDAGSTKGALPARSS